MAGVRNWKVSIIEFWGSFILGSAISYAGLLKINSAYEQTRKENNNVSHDLDMLYSCQKSIWRKILLLNDNFNWIQRCLEDVGPSVLQERTTKEISKALSSHFAKQSGLTSISLKLLQEWNTRQSRLFLTDIIGRLDNIEDKDIQSFLSSCDERVLVGLARLPDINNNILKALYSTKKQEGSDPESPMENHLRTLLLSLPSQGMDSCTKWFTNSAIHIGTSCKKHKRSLPWSFGGDSSLSFAHNFTSMPAEQIELYYLKALTRHSMVSSHSQIMVENGVLQLLSKELQKRRNNLRISREIAHIIGNIALEPVTHTDIIQHGFLVHLRRWLSSEDLALSTHAARALANLDKDFNQKECYEDGVYILHPDKRHRNDVVADIVFVHGLRGGPLKTWRIEGSKSRLTGEQCWPKAWLVKDFPNVRVIMVEYDSYLSNWVSQCPTQPQTRSLAFRSEEIMKKLHRAGVGKRPVIWISHSMGGLLVKQLLSYAQDDSEYRCLCDWTNGVVFYSTPHKGSALASYSSQARYFLLPSVEVKELCLGSAYLADLHSKFLKLLDTKRFKCLSIGETIPLKLSWLWNSVLVDEDSANFGFGQYYSLDTNHINVCKPIHPNDPRYQHTKDFVQDTLRQ